MKRKSNLRRVQMCLGYVQNTAPYCRRARGCQEGTVFYLLKHTFAFVCYIMFTITAEAKVQPARGSGALHLGPAMALTDGLLFPSLGLLNCSNADLD